MKNLFTILLFAFTISASAQTKDTAAKSTETPACFTKHHWGFFVALGASYNVGQVVIPVSLGEYNSTIPVYNQSVITSGYTRTSYTNAPSLTYGIGAEYSTKIDDPVFFVLDMGLSGYNFGGKVTDVYYVDKANGNPPPNYYTVTYSIPQTSYYYYTLSMLDISPRLYVTVKNMGNKKLSVGVGGHLALIISQQNSDGSPQSYNYYFAQDILTACVRYSYSSKKEALHTLELYCNLSQATRTQTNWVQQFAALGLQFIF